MMKKITKKIIFLFILALLLRILFLGAESLWLDEGVSLYQSGTTFSHLVTQVKEDIHVPLYPLMLFGWLQIFNDSAVSIRMLSVLFGAFSVTLLYAIGRKLFDEKSAFIASIMLALSPIAIFYSQEARVYSLLVFLVLLSTFFLLNYLQGKKYYSWFLMFTNTLIFYTHIYGALFILMQSLYVIHCKKFTLRWFISQVSAVILFLPWLTILLKQLLIVQRNLGWINLLNGFVLGEYLIYFMGSFIVFGICIAAWVLHPKVDRFLLLFSLPLFIVIVMGFFIPIFHERYILYTLPFLYLFFATKLTKIPVVFTYIVIIALLAVSFHQGMTLQKDDWKSIAADILEFNRTVLVHPYYQQEVLSYYVDKDCFYSDDVYGCMARNHSIISLSDEENHCTANASVSNYWPLGFYAPVMLIDVRSYLYDDIPCNLFFNNSDNGYILKKTKTYNGVTWWQYTK